MFHGLPGCFVLYPLLQSCLWPPVSFLKISRVTWKVNVFFPLIVFIFLLNASKRESLEWEPGKGRKPVKKAEKTSIFWVLEGASNEDQTKGGKCKRKWEKTENQNKKKKQRNGKENLQCCFCSFSSVGEGDALQTQFRSLPREFAIWVGRWEKLMQKTSRISIYFSVTHPEAYFILGRGGNDRLLLLIGFGSNCCLLFGT